MKKGGQFGHIVTEETRRKISIGHKGKKNSKEHNKKVSEALKGIKYPNRKRPIPFTEEHKRKISENSAKYWLGKKMPAEIRRKIGLARKGVKQSPEWIKKRFEWHKNYKYTDEHRKNISLANKGKKGFVGEDHYNWQGGKSFERYTLDWNNTLKRSIRERDHYTCQLCSKQQEEIAFCIHHIDYNKKDCNPNNLITLCRNCHTKTNYNREYWINYFKIYAT